MTAPSKAELSAKDLKPYLCPWCDESHMVVRESGGSCQNGAGRISWFGYKVTCAEPLSGCPEITGTCKTVSEAVGYAIDQCIEIGQERVA